MNEAPSRREGAATGERPCPRTMRLQRFLARAGVASRRGSEALMSAGRVRVNGEPVCELGSKIDPDRDRVEVDGRLVEPGGSPVYLMLNKPAGCVTTMSDPQGRPCVAELVATHRHPGLFPVGRLDRDTTGVLLFTTDGDFAQSLLHPSHHVDKIYVAEVGGIVADVELDVLRSGIEIDDGPCRPAACRLLATDAPRCSSTIELTIHEGRKNQVKRMFAAIGHPVRALERTSFGGVRADGLAAGACRELTDAELERLRTGARKDA